MNKSITCCFTGHRTLPENQLCELANRLEETLEELIRDKGVRIFKAGGALGFDTCAALTVIRLKQRHPDIRLVLVLPCEDQTRYWNAHDKAVYNEILQRADEALYIARRAYRGCMHARNRRLVEQSAWCVCYLTQARGGSRYTVNYARKKGLNVINLAEPPGREETAISHAPAFSQTPAARPEPVGRPFFENAVSSKDACGKTAFREPDLLNASPQKSAPRFYPEGSPPWPRLATLKMTIDAPDVCSPDFRARIAARNKNAPRLKRKPRKK